MNDEVAFVKMRALDAMARTLLSSTGMNARIALFCGLVSVTGCGGSTSSDGNVTDGGADGTSDSAVTDTTGKDTITPPPDVACKDCVTATLTWSASGGLAFREDSSTVTACRTYEHKQTSGGGPPDKTCTQELAACGTSGGVTDVQRALGGIL